jgi:hypothetical protein
MIEEPHGIKSQKAAFFITITVKPSNLTSLKLTTAAV